MSDVITELTPEQEAKLEAFRDEYLRYGLGSGKAVLDQVLEPLTAFYKRVGYDQPNLIQCSSPFVAQIMINIMDNDRFEELMDAVHGRDMDKIKEVYFRVFEEPLNEEVFWLWLSSIVTPVIDEDDRGGLNDALRATFADRPARDYLLHSWNSVNEQLATYINLPYDQIGVLEEDKRDQVIDKAAEFVQSILTALETSFETYHTYIWGSLDAYWVAFYLFPHLHVRELYEPEDVELLRQWDVLVKSCGFVYTFENFAFVCDRPSEIHLDDNDRLHNLSGPSVGFDDGWRLYHIHGIEVDSYIIEEPEKITVAGIDGESNVEVRRVMIDQYGLERYLLDGKAEIIDQDERGKLYRKPQANDEDIYVVRVTNSTPEPDGSFKDYFLRVPPTMRTAAEAVAWTFDIEPSLYNPFSET